MSDFFQDQTEETAPVVIVPTETVPEEAAVVVSPPVAAPTVVLETPHARQERLDREADEARKADFVSKILAAREPVPVPPPQPSHPQILKATEAEMAEGRRQNAIHEAAKAIRPQGAATPTVAELASQGKTSSVFRPHNYHHEKGNVQGKNLTVGEMPSR